MLFIVCFVRHVNDVIGKHHLQLHDRIFLNHNLLSGKLAPIDTDDCYNKVKKSTKFQSNADIFDGDMSSSNFEVMSDNL